LKKHTPHSWLGGLLVAAWLLTGCTPATVASTPSPGNTPAPTATPPLARTVTPVTEATRSEPDPLRYVPAPDGRWTAVVGETAGSLDLQSAKGEVITVFPDGSTVGTVNWSPDSRHLLVVRTHTHWRRSPPSPAIQVDGPIEIWQIRLEDDQPGPPRLVFQSPTQPDESGAFTPEQIAWGSWSPNNRFVLFWHSILSASAMADGMTMWALDAQAGEAIPLAGGALLNPRYQSWAPDGSALVFTAGGGRSAQANKWLNLFDVSSGQVTTVVSKTEQIPGIVAWSPQGDLIAYAAVPAAETGPGMADWMVFENPAIAGRRVYLLDPATGQQWRLNDTDAFQDAPTWSDDGAILYYVQREDDTMALMAADPATDQAQVVECSHQPAPRAVGYYGQSKWDDLVAYRPEVPRETVPPLTETYNDPTHGYTLRYPAGWHVGQGWQSLIGWQEMLTLTSYPPDATPPDLGPFSGQALIAVQVMEVPAGDLETLLDDTLASPGPGQIPIPDRVRVLTAFDQQERTVDGRSAVRLETMGDFGTVNHVLVVLDGTRGYVLRGQGDGRVFDAVAESLRLP
jgi:WD40 repeat protein